MAAGLVLDRAIPGAHIWVELGLAACLLGTARAAGVTAAELGLARMTMPAGRPCTKHPTWPPTRQSGYGTSSRPH